MGRQKGPQGRVPLPPQFLRGTKPGETHKLSSFKKQGYLERRPTTAEIFKLGQNLPFCPPRLASFWGNTDRDIKVWRQVSRRSSGGKRTFAGNGLQSSGPGTAAQGEAQVLPSNNRIPRTNFSPVRPAILDPGTLRSRTFTPVGIQECFIASSTWRRKRARSAIEERALDPAVASKFAKSNGGTGVLARSQTD